jgi:hypothetical protein
MSNEFSEAEYRLEEAISSERTNSQSPIEGQTELGELECRNLSLKKSIESLTKVLSKKKKKVESGTKDRMRKPRLIKLFSRYSMYSCLEISPLQISHD